MTTAVAKCYNARLEAPGYTAGTPLAALIAVATTDARAGSKGPPKLSHIGGAFGLGLAVLVALTAVALLALAQIIPVLIVLAPLLIVGLIAGVLLWAAVHKRHEGRDEGRPVGS